jgi:NADPH:quinone reductase-like Zn-dependent oxidoreductase
MRVSGPALERLELIDVPVPEPGPGEVQVRIRAATLNYRDLLLVQRGNPDGKLPYVPLSCACGEVAALGAGVSRVQPGDRVMPGFFQDWVSGPMPQTPHALGGALDGVAREFACFPEQALARVPDQIGDLEAATLPCAGLTAWHALFCAHATKPGDTVLLLGTGGVSIAGLQLAKAAGARVIITSSSDAKLARARAMGADATINYRATPDWGDAALALTGGRGVDLVLEVGGADTLEQSMRALREGGEVAGIGLLTGKTVWQVKDAAAKLLRIRVGSREQLEDLARGVVASRVRPVVDRVFPLEQLGKALATLASGRFFGKIGLEIG